MRPNNPNSDTSASADEHNDIGRVPLTFTEIGARVSGAAIVRRIMQKTSRADTPYLDVELGHAEGKTLVKVWAVAMPAWADIREGQAVYVGLESKAGWRAGTLEWSLTSVTALPDEHAIRDDVLRACPAADAELTARCRSTDGRPKPVFMPGTQPPVGQRASEDGEAAAEAAPPRPRHDGPTLQLIVLRDAAAGSTTTPMEDA